MSSSSPTSLQPETAAPTASGGWAKYLRWGLVLLPWLISAWLVHKYAFNQRIMDDWWLGEDLVKFKAGELTITDLLGVQMEHRIFVPRVLALALGLAFQGDMRALMGLTMLLFTLEYVFVVWLWFRRTDLKVWPATVGCFVSGLLLLSPMQFQNFHFGICFLTVLPVLSLAGVFRIMQTSWPDWVRLPLCLVCAWVGMLSFSPGMMTWALPLPVFLWSAQMKGSSARKRFIGAWLLICVVSFALYFHNFKNAAPPAYAYGQTGNNVLASDTMYFMHHLGEAVGFWLRWLGSYLSHGLHCSQATAALSFGILEVSLLLGLVIYTLRHWADEGLRKKLVLWICYGLYSCGTGGMIMVGRLWMEPHEGTSLNLRYHVHQVPLLVALLAGGWIVAKHWLANRSRERIVVWAQFGYACLGGLMVLQVLQWIYGSELMALWRQRHVQDALVQKFLPLSQENFYANKISGDFDYGKKVAIGLEKLGYLDKFFTTDALDQFKRQRLPGAPNFAAFNRLWKTPDGTWWVDGFSLLKRDLSRGRVEANEERKDYREADREHLPCDLILLTFRKTPQDPWRIFGYTPTVAVPFPIHEWYEKDLGGIVYHTWPWPRAMNGAWGSEVGLMSEPPPDAEISAWSLDYDGLKVQRIPFGPAFAPSKNPGSVRDLEAVRLPDLMRGFITDPAVSAPAATTPSPTPPP